MLCKCEIIIIDAIVSFILNESENIVIDAIASFVMSMEILLLMLLCRLCCNVWLFC